jgi:hypothetical protein
LVFRVTLRSSWPTVYSTSSTLEIGEVRCLHEAGHYELMTADINGLIAGITPTERLDESVKHALQVREALANSNYHRFFKLFAAAPKMGAYLMDHFLSRERVAALAIMSRACVAISPRLAELTLAQIHIPPADFHCVGAGVRRRGGGPRLSPRTRGGRLPGHGFRQARDSGRHEESRLQERPGGPCGLITELHQGGHQVSVLSCCGPELKRCPGANSDGSP